MHLQLQMAIVKKVISNGASKWHKIYMFRFVFFTLISCKCEMRMGKLRKEISIDG